MEAIFDKLQSLSHDIFAAEQTIKDYEDLRNKVDSLETNSLGILELTKDNSTWGWKIDGRINIHITKEDLLRFVDDELKKSKEKKRLILEDIQLLIAPPKEQLMSAKDWDIELPCDDLKGKSEEVQPDFTFYSDADIMPKNNGVPIELYIPKDQRSYLAVFKRLAAITDKYRYGIFILDNKKSKK